jgi:RNA polymerase sigma-70 factor (ECF subfamily)
MEQGDRQVAWRAWRERLRGFVAKQVPASDVEDVLQDTLLRIWRGLRDVRDEQRIDGWIYQVARSAIKDAWRRDGRRRHHEQAFVSESEALQSDQIDAVLPNEAFEPADLLALTLGGFVEGLSPAYREILRLTEIQGLTQQEAATQLGLSLSGAKSRVQRGRRLLRQELEACCRLGFDARGRVIECALHETGGGCGEYTGDCAREAS